MTVAVTTSTTALTPITVFAAAGGDRERWAGQAAQNGTNWAGVLDGARDLLAVAVGEVSTMGTFERACREADRKAAERSVGAKTLRARRLLDDGTSYERAYGEILRDLTAPEALVEALMFSLWRGVNELTQPDTLRRLSALDREQIKHVCRRVQNLKPEIAPAWSADAVDALISAWKKSHGQAV
jgi:hypothetical protein